MGHSFGVLSSVQLSTSKELSQHLKVLESKLLLSSTTIQNLFFGAPHVTSPSTVQRISQRLEIPGCKSVLQDHQFQALNFLLENEGGGKDAVEGLWHHQDNDWIRVFCQARHSSIDASQLNFGCRGSLLADDMGLGKTLTTLALIKQTQQAANDFHNCGKRGKQVTSPATLVICPLSTLDNWKNEIEIHFEHGSLPFVIFHGPPSIKYEIEKLQQTAIVLTTYKVINPVGDPKHQKMKRVDLSGIEWFRIVLDEAQ